MDQYRGRQHDMLQRRRLIERASQQQIIFTVGDGAIDQGNKGRVGKVQAEENGGRISRVSLESDN